MKKNATLKIDLNANLGCLLFDIKTEDLIALAIEKGYEQHYTKKFKEENPINDKIRLEVLGKFVSVYSEWEGERIFKVVDSALADSNYHSLNSQFEILLNKMERNDKEVIILDMDIYQKLIDEIPEEKVFEIMKVKQVRIVGNTEENQTEQAKEEN